MKCDTRSFYGTFFDAVVAIEITLLGLEFVVPLLEHSNEGLLSFLEEIMDQIVKYYNNILFNRFEIIVMP